MAAAAFGWQKVNRTFSENLGLYIHINALEFSGFPVFRFSGFPVFRFSGFLLKRFSLPQTRGFSEKNDVPFSGQT